jgi:hydrogenase maturation protein HypF
LGLCQINQYEGQAAMALENSAASMPSDQHYQFLLNHCAPIVIDWQITIEQLLKDSAHNPPELIAINYTNTLAEIMLAIAERAGQKNIVLSGGCFQNACLVEKAVRKLKTAGFKVYCHEKIPPNDGGLALGQLYAAKYI